jgi:short chain dehydrogenase
MSGSRPTSSTRAFVAIVSSVRTPQIFTDGNHTSSRHNATLEQNASVRRAEPCICVEQIGRLRERDQDVGLLGMRFFGAHLAMPSAAWFQNYATPAIVGRITSKPESEKAMPVQRNAIITGSTSGIGLGVARALARAGMNVTINGFGETGGIQAERTKIEKEFGVECRYSAADMSKPDQIVALVRDTEREFGTVDVLVNNAGVQFVSPIEDFPPEKWDQIIAIDLSSAFHATRAVVPGMKQRKWGRIISTASAHSLVASPFKSAKARLVHKRRHARERQRKARGKCEGENRTLRSGLPVPSACVRRHRPDALLRQLPSFLELLVQPFGNTEQASHHGTRPINILAPTLVRPVGRRTNRNRAQVRHLVTVAPIGPPGDGVLLPNRRQ